MIQQWCSLQNLIKKLGIAQFFILYATYARHQILGIAETYFVQLGILATHFCVVGARHRIHTAQGLIQYRCLYSYHLLRYGQ